MELVESRSVVGILLDSVSCHVRIGRLGRLFTMVSSSLAYQEGLAFTITAMGLMETPDKSI